MRAGKSAENPRLFPADDDSGLRAGGGKLLPALDGDAATFAVTFAIGVLVQAIQPLFAHIQMGVLLGNFVGGWLTAVAAQMLYGVLPIYNVNAAIIGGIMPLLSGLAMTTAVRDTMYGDLISGMTRALEAMLLATAVAIGVYTGLKMAAMMGGIAL